MLVPDVNLLIYAYNAKDPQHQQARDWWETCLNGDKPIGLTWGVISGFIRLITHPRDLVTPMPSDHALAHVRTWWSNLLFSRWNRVNDFRTSSLV